MEEEMIINQNKLEEGNSIIQDIEGTEIDQVISDLESYFQQPGGQECDTECNQVEENTMEHIFVLQNIDTPPTHTITQSGQLMPADLLKQPQSSKYPQHLTKQVPEQDDIQNNIKLKEHLQRNYQLQDTEGTEIDQVISNLESYFQQPVGQKCDTEWNQVEEHTMEHIFVLRDNHKAVNIPNNKQNKSQSKLKQTYRGILSIITFKTHIPSKQR